MASPNFTRSLGQRDKSLVSRQKDNLLRPADQDGWVGNLVWSSIMLVLIVPLLLWGGVPYLVVWLLMLVAANLSATIAEQLPSHRHRSTVGLRIAALSLLPLALAFVTLALTTSEWFTGFMFWALLFAYGYGTTYVPLRNILGYDARAKRERALTEPTQGLDSGIDYARRGGTPQPYEPHRPRDKRSKR